MLAAIIAIGAGHGAGDQSLSLPRVVGRRADMPKIGANAGLALQTSLRIERRRRRATRPANAADLIDSLVRGATQLYVHGQRVGSSSALDGRGVRGSGWEALIRLARSPRSNKGSARSTPDSSTSALLASISRRLRATVFFPRFWPRRTRQPHAGSTLFARHHSRSVLFWRMNAALTGGRRLGRCEVAAGMEPTPERNRDEEYVDAALLLSNCFAELLPQFPEDVSFFLSEVALALDEREADLSRLLGVSHATLSSWKRRGSIPEPHLVWFGKSFVPAILRRIEMRRVTPFHEDSLQVALAVLKQTNFDVFYTLHDSDAYRVSNASRLLVPLSRLGLFVRNRLNMERNGQPIDEFVWFRVVPKVVELARFGTTTGPVRPSFGSVGVRSDVTTLTV